MEGRTIPESGLARRSLGALSACRMRHSPPGVELPAWVSIMPRDDFRPRAPYVAQGVEHGAGEPRMAARAPAEVNDRIVVPDRRHRLDDLRRRRSLQFVEQGLPRPGIAAQPERDRRRAPVRGRAVEEARVKTVGGNVRAGREREGRTAYRGVLMVEERVDEGGRQGKAGGCGGLQGGRQKRGRQALPERNPPERRARIRAAEPCEGVDNRKLLG